MKIGGGWGDGSAHRYGNAMSAGEGSGYGRGGGRGNVWGEGWGDGSGYGSVNGSGVGNGNGSGKGSGVGNGSVGCGAILLAAPDDVTGQVLLATWRCATNHQPLDVQYV